VRSIVRSNGSDDERPSQEESEQNFNINLINDNNSLSEAAGYDSSRLGDIDADAAFALQLQQEEYTKESLMPNGHQYLPFQIEPDDESEVANPPFLFDSDTPQFTNDEQLAAYLQAQENRNRQAYRRPPISFFPIRQQSNTASSQTSETDEPENELIAPFRFAQRPPLYNEDDDDEESPHMNNAHAFLQFLASQGHPLPGGLAPMFSGYRRRHRRTGNLQDTEDDFGPEDYEVILIDFFYISNDYF
jgi:hypothetical protein